MITTKDFSDVTLASEDTNHDGSDDHNDTDLRFTCDKSYQLMKVREVKIVEEVERSDGL